MDSLINELSNLKLNIKNNSILDNDLDKLINNFSQLSISLDSNKEINNSDIYNLCSDFSKIIINYSSDISSDIIDKYCKLFNQFITHLNNKKKCVSKNNLSIPRYVI
jgi:hypothetical protein